MNNSWPRVTDEMKRLWAPSEQVEPAFNGTVLEGRKRRYTVIKEEDLQMYIGMDKKEELFNVLGEIQSHIQDCRTSEGKKPYNSYIVINTDEPYINDVLRVMKHNGHWEGEIPVDEEEDNLLDHFSGPLVIHQNEDGSVQLRDSISRFWCACGNAAVKYNPGNIGHFKFRCIKCSQKDREV
ncbi:hypothetical protein [Pontibacillus salipaludis]|uniref:Uncharacterized protein n=1 Tax=Pontibacillus salipaludis TaxID=1697394 RepID=A0ABQ1PVZ4_9BACI|nr:hypothetical protein [Pontibacillus salipaludis]GGD05218.1 hypothetical protein GCM10011389_10910 [Pontibacillus salipaludis]